MIDFILGCQKKSKASSRVLDPSLNYRRESSSFLFSPWVDINSSSRSDNDIANNYQKLRETCHSLELSDLEKKIIRQVILLYLFSEYHGY